MLRKGYYLLKAFSREDRASVREARRFLRLKNLVEQAYERSPFYRQKYDAAGFHPGDLKTIADFSGIPVLTKDELNSYRQLLVAKIDPGKDHLLFSSGTTGSPAVILHDSRHIDVTTAYFARYLISIGFRPGDSLVMYRRPDWKLMEATTFAYHRLGLVRKYWVDSSRSHLKQWETLKLYRPDFIIGYPNSLRKVGDLLRKTGERGLLGNLKAIVSFGERLSDDTRLAISDSFGCPVYNWYATTEFWSMASECRSGRSLHVEDDLVYLETIVDRKTVSGEPGAIVCTDLTIRTMPLIRYATGDPGTLSTDQCICGSSRPVLIDLGGYRCNEIKTIVSRFSAAADYLESRFLAARKIGNFQFVAAKDNGSATLLLERGIGSFEQTAARIMTEVGTLVDVPFTIREVTDLPNEPSGKFNRLIN